MKIRLTAAMVIIALAITTGLVTAAKQQAKTANKSAVCPMAGAGGAQGAAAKAMDFGPQMARELNLTDNQIQQLQKLCNDFMTSTADRREQLRTETKTMTELLTADSISADAIKAEAAKIDNIRASIRNEAIDSIAKGVELLNSDQQAKLRQMIKDHPEIAIGLGMGCALGPGCEMGYGCQPGATCPAQGK